MRRMWLKEAKDTQRARGNWKIGSQEKEPGVLTNLIPDEEKEEGTSIPIDWVRVTLAFVFPALGGLLFGYDIGATSGALVSLTSATTSGMDWYNFSPFQSGFVVSSSLAGALVSSIFAFFYGDELGRRKEIILASGFYFLGSLLECTCQSFNILIVGRIVYGISIGFAMHGAPAYIAETSPQSVRGLLVSLKEALIVLGILLGYLTSYLFVSMSGGWRIIYGCAMPITVVLLCGMYWLPASPRWLLLRKQSKDTVLNSLKKLRGPSAKAGDLEYEMEQIEAGLNNIDSTEKGFGALLKKKNLKPLTIGILLMVFQQITGQPSVLYYAARIFQDAGFPAAESATAVSVILGFFKLIMTGIAVVTVDVAGRRPLLLTGVGGMVLALVALGTIKNPIFSVIALLVYVGCYQVSFGPISWLIVGEIFPLAVRSSAIALASFANFGGNFLVSLILPGLQSALGISNTYLAFGAVGVIAVATIYFLVPETKGKSLEEIEEMFD